MPFGLTKLARLVVALILAAATAEAARATATATATTTAVWSCSSSASRSSPPERASRTRRSAGCPASRDKRRHVYYALSDDQTNVRFYTLRIDISAGVPAVQIVAVTSFGDATGEPFAPPSVDPEGLTLTNYAALVTTSEGFATRLIDPWVREFGLDGRQLRSLPYRRRSCRCRRQPRRPSEPRLRECRADAQPAYVFTGTEAALVQDGPPATLTNGSPARLLRYDLKRGTLDRQFVYWTDPIREPPVPATQFAVSGLVDLFPLRSMSCSRWSARSRSARRDRQQDPPLRRLAETCRQRQRLRQPRDAARRPATGEEDPRPRPRRARNPARQRRGDDVWPASEPRPPLAAPRQRQQLRTGSIHPVPVVFRVLRRLIEPGPGQALLSVAID